MTVPPRGHRQHTWHSSEVPGAPVEKCIPPWNWQKCCMYTVRCCSRSCFMACEAHMRHGGWSPRWNKDQDAGAMVTPPTPPPPTTLLAPLTSADKCGHVSDHVIFSQEPCVVFLFFFILGSRMMMLGRGGRFVPRFIKGFMNSGWKEPARLQSRIPDCFMMKQSSSTIL